MTNHQFWHWPDHVIYKRESRELREEHNRLGNSHAKLVTALERIARDITTGTYAKGIARAALADVEQIGGGS